MGEVNTREMLGRVELLLGTEALEKIRSQRVIIFGTGGVGSWCAESLVRSGIKKLTIVDDDNVAASNVNRQLMATSLTIGQKKVEVLKKRLLEISPDAEIRAIQTRYSEETNAEFGLDKYDYIIDCIDSLKDKIALLINATHTDATVFSSMGAALKIDPTKIRVAEYWKVRGCPLGAALRKKMKRAHQTLAKPVLCVYSEELLDNKGFTDETCSYKAQMNGTLAHITAIFGFTIAGLVMQHITR